MEGHNVKILIVVFVISLLLLITTEIIHLFPNWIKGKWKKISKLKHEREK